MFSADAVYLDYNATSPLLAAARRRMRRSEETWGNPSSPHAFGQRARASLEEAREEIAACIGCNRGELIFTSGGTEADNTALNWLATEERPLRVITSGIEHPAVLQTCKWLEHQGVEVRCLPIDVHGQVCVEALPELLTPHTRMLSVMAANNETGVVQPLAALAKVLRSHPGGERVLFHSDAVQAFARIPLAWREWGVDLLSISAHKLGGPKGIGALVAVEGKQPPPLLWGGKQERSRRAGSEALMLAEGFAGALSWLWPRLPAWRKRMEKLRTQLEQGLAKLPNFFINGRQAPRLPNTFNGGIEGLAAESLVVALDLLGIAISSGSACSSGAQEPSHVLRAMGVSDQRLRSSIRISLGSGVQQQHIACCVAAIQTQAARLQHISRHA